MEFEYTSTITISEYDMDRICNDVKGGRDFGDAFDDALSGYDDCDYYHMGDFYDAVEKEIKRRIKESEKEETKMPMVTRDMTDEELIALREIINETLAEREKEKNDEAIENFSKVFEEIQKRFSEIGATDEKGTKILYLNDFTQFFFVR